MIFPNIQCLIGAIISNELTYEISNMLRINKLHKNDLKNIDRIIDRVMTDYYNFIESKDFKVQLPSLEIQTDYITYLNKSADIIINNQLVKFPEGFVTDGFIWDEKRIILKDLVMTNVRAAHPMDFTTYEDPQFSIKNNSDLSVTYFQSSNSIRIQVPIYKLTNNFKRFVDDKGKISLIKFHLPLIKNLRLEVFEPSNNFIKVFNCEHDDNPITQIRNFH